MQLYQGPKFVLLLHRQHILYEDVEHARVQNLLCHKPHPHAAVVCIGDVTILLYTAA